MMDHRKGTRAEWLAAQGSDRLGHQGDVEAVEVRNDAVEVTARLRLARPARVRDRPAGRSPAAAAERVTARPPVGLGEIHAFAIFGFAAVLFFVMSFPLTRLAARLEKRLV